MKVLVSSISECIHLQVRSDLRGVRVRRGDAESAGSSGTRAASVRKVIREQEASAAFLAHPDPKERRATQWDHRPPW